ncbi:MAG: TraR/DksA C4-type zinc finger protein [Verrucomicrobiota bacterium]
MPAKKKTKKKTVAKKAVKKVTKKTVAKKAVKKTAKKKVAVKKAPVKKKAAAKKAVKKTVAKPVKKAVKKVAKKTAKPVKKAVKKAAKPAPAKSAKTKKKSDTPPIDSKAKEIVLGARKRTSTPPVFKQRKAKSTPVVFTMEDVEDMLTTRKKGEEKKTSSSKSSTAAKKQTSAAKDKEIKVKHRNHAAASLTDILGFNPADKAASRSTDKVPSKHAKYYKALLELRDHVNDGLQQHAADTLKRSNKDDAGDLSGYGQHMADAGTDTFDRDFALSLVSSEQEALYEIEEAIQRIFDGTYGVCEITGSAIAKDRLLAVPFTRYSLEGQRELEKQHRNKVQRVGVLNEDSDETISFTDDDNDS